MSEEPKITMNDFMGPEKRRSIKDHPLYALAFFATILAGAFWLYNNSKTREQQRQREIMRQCISYTDSNGHLHITPASDNARQKIQEINKRYSRPIWETVDEDFSVPDDKSIHRH